jgi:hypothetical protein
MDTWSLGPHASVDTHTVLPAGFHPLAVRDRCDALRLHLTMPSLDRVGRGTIMTDWDGRPLTTPIPIITKSCETLEAAIGATIRVWHQVVAQGFTGVVMSDAAAVQRIVNQVTYPLLLGDRDREHAPLEAGEYVAYFVPDVPVDEQAEFIITQVTSTNPFTLANGHHKSVFTTGHGHLARYNPSSNRVVFPALHMRDVVVASSG